MKATRRDAQRRLWRVGVMWLISVISFVYAGVVYLVVQSVLTSGEPVSRWWLISSQATGFISALSFLSGLGLSLICLLGRMNEINEQMEASLEGMRRLVQDQPKVEAILTQMSENVLLSDEAKSIAFREKDRAVVLEAIGQDIRRGRWKSAELLIEGMAQRFGHEGEAERLREQLERYRQSSIEEKIDTTIKHIESLWLIHSYKQAQEEEEALLRMYRDNEKVQSLKGQTEQRRLGHKKGLLGRWNKAVQAKDYEQGVELLKLLDGYLTPSEAAALEESARGVFRGKLQNMGVEFSNFVEEKHWDKALKVGRAIIEEFPNSRMAQEVRDKLEILEQRATEERV